MLIRNCLLLLIINFGLICENWCLVANHSADRQNQRYTFDDLRNLHQSSANQRDKFLPKGSDANNRKGFENLLKIHKKELLSPSEFSLGGKQNYSDGVRRVPNRQNGEINNKTNNTMKLFDVFKKSEQKVSEAQIQCNFETDCLWKWKTEDRNGFFVATGGSNIEGLEADADNKSTGHFLLFRSKPKAKISHVTSPFFRPSSANCRIQLWIFQKYIVGGMISIVVENVNHIQWLISDIPLDNQKEWIRHERVIGKQTRDIQIIVKIVPSQRLENVVAIDNLQLLDCFPESDQINSCTSSQYRCHQTNVCINTTSLCDITQDCEFGDDELQNCDKIPYGAQCNFEQDWCGWYNTNGNFLQWARNVTGKYMYVSTPKDSKDLIFSSSATLKSIIFNPPPKVHGNSSSKYYNSCTIRFYLYQYGIHKSGMMLQVTEMRPKENVTSEILWSYNDFGDKWMRKTVFLPNITHKYYLHFDARKGIRYMGDVGIDDFSMSPECFGLNIPQSELNNYNYWNPDVEYPSSAPPHKDFVNKTYYEFTTCGVAGRYGPVQDNCTKAYINTSVNVQVMHTPGMNGFQNWMAPAEGYYTFIVLGASGGKGSGEMGLSRGAMVRTVMELRKWQEILILVGQEGTNACVKNLGLDINLSCKSLKNHNTKNLTGVRGVLNMEVTDRGGGGGGGSFVFIRNRTRHLIPLVIAAGGGGLGLGRFIDTGSQHGQAINMSHPPITGEMYGMRSAGAGGGWRIRQGQVSVEHMRLMGLPLVQGGVGGQACYESTDGRSDGGFGGGGGGCTAGGRGGGYSGGNAWSTNSTNGEGGSSFLDSSRTIPTFSMSWSGYHAGPGSVIIIPAISGCGCNYKCLALDIRKSEVACICPKDWKLDVDGKNCILLNPANSYPIWIVVLSLFMFLSVIVLFGFVCFMLYSRYQHRGSVPIMSYNLNYEFGGSIYSVQDLKEIPRNQLKLEKIIGKGEFGEVYQGSYYQKFVAVKTLLMTSNPDAEVNFLMEALITSQFNHPNIVNFIGVCLDKHPRYIILELLEGGNLKNFLRESREEPNEDSLLTMKDLMMMAIDAAKGCLYMESHRFIHRDIAARNCLLTTKGPGRVVKIADFGMSRDIYISDYYRKDGRAKIPVKWMPPEAFLDGIFTSETDVWSFGVLLWEIMSMGFVPYTGCANNEVMKLVTSGGRLEPPANCPCPIYRIMTQCWHPEPAQRPNFSLIMQRLNYCLQDPNVTDLPLPIFTPLSSPERDMRSENDDHNTEISKLADYLIPNMTAQFDVRSSTSLQDVGKNQDEHKMIDKLLAGEKILPTFLANQILANHVPKCNSLRAGISLDVRALLRQSLSAKNSYANMNASGNEIIQNGPWSLPKESCFLSNPSYSYLKTERTNRVLEN